MPHSLDHRVTTKSIGMKVVLIGHPNVRDLENLEQHSFSAENITLHVKYVHQPGVMYELFLNNPGLLDPAFEFEPDCVLVVLAGK